MNKFVLAAIGMLLLLGSGAQASGRAGTVTLDFDLGAQGRGREVRLWIPLPTSDAHQVVSNVKLSGDYDASGFNVESQHASSLVYASWAKADDSRRLTLSFDIRREEVRGKDFPASEPKWNPADYEMYLAPTSLGPTDGAVKELAEKITADKTTVYDRARAIYDWTVENMYRDPDTVGCGVGDVCSLLVKPGGKCTDISSVFIALCRASGIPAREVFGLRLGKTAEQDVTTWQHCWSEFFLPDYGWVTADPADVRKAMLVEKLDLSSPRTMELREYFWGGVDAYRFALASGRDVVLNPPQAGAPLNTFGYPYAEADGKALDFYAPKTFIYNFMFKEIN